MATKVAVTLKPVTLAQARDIVAKFAPNAKVNGARVRVLIPHVKKSADTIVDEIVSAYTHEGVELPFAFGSSTIDTALWVARAWASIAMSVRSKLSTDDATSVMDALVQVRRTPQRLPVVTASASAVVKRETVGKQKFIAGGEPAANALIGALVKAEPKLWAGIATNTRATIVKAANLKRAQARAGGKPGGIVADDDAAADVATAHNSTAEDSRTGDEGATKNNTKAHRASKHERKDSTPDPLRGSHDTDTHMPADNSGNPAPAKLDPLREASVGALVKELQKRLILGYVPTGAEDLAMTELAATWSARVEDAPAKMAGKYLERTSAPVSEALVGAGK